MSTVSPELLTGFLDEARGYLASLRNALVRSKGAPDQKLLQEIYRQMSVLAGGADMLGLELVVTLSGPAVDMLASLVETGAGLGEAGYQQLVDTLDQIEGVLNAPPVLDNGSPEPSAGGASDGHLLPPDLPPELLEIFLLEAREHNAVIQSGLEQLRSQPGDTALLSELRRVTHTLKGAAASVGFAPMAHLAHLMEELFEQHLTNGHLLASEAVELLFDSADVLENMLVPGQDGDTRTHFEAIDQRYAALLGDMYPQQTKPKPDALPLVPQEPSIAPQQVQVEDTLRLSLANMDLLINRVGEIIINRSALERHLGTLRNLLVELDRSTKRLSQVAHGIDVEIEIALPARTSDSQTRDSGFDPLELERYSLLYQLARELEEVAADTGGINSQLHFLSDDLDIGLTRERRLTTELQDGLLATRLVPLYTLETRIRRTVHRTARDLGKSVEVILNGFGTKVDKTVLDALADPIMHLLRNAVDHGIETPAVRDAAHKPPTGRVVVNVSRERGRVIVTLSDDGKGIDLKQVQHHAVELGLIGQDIQPGSQQLLNLLFEEGFSLAESVTQTSGRGVGLDIVRRAVHRLQGTVRIDNQPGHGVIFTISVPVTLAITQALFITSCGQGFAVPLEQIAMVLRLEADLVDDLRDQGVLRYDGRSLATYNLAEFIGGPEAARATPCYGLLVEAGSQEMVVLVEGIGGIHDAVVKSLGAHLRRVPGMAGATIAGDGGVTLILDLTEIVAVERPPQQVVSPVPVTLPMSVATAVRHVLVVDDSPSVRRVVCSFLERKGWQTTDAKDGIEALDKLASNQPDVALVDIEMPRMNGYELLTRIKSDPDLRHIPVVFLTSRSAAKHRERARQLQVDGYLVKPYRENELLDELTRVIRE
jgi:chemosensory pili system protein ChpA (sensor histidine kinase/response regulator)